MQHPRADTGVKPHQPHRRMPGIHYFIGTPKIVSGLALYSGTISKNVPSINHPGSADFSCRKFLFFNISPDR